MAKKQDEAPQPVKRFIGIGGTEEFIEPPLAAPVVDAEAHANEVGHK